MNKPSTGAADGCDDVSAPAHSPGAFDRRSALIGSFALAVLAACTPDEKKVAPAADAGAEKAPPPANAKTAFLPVMVAIADRLFPKDDSGPGAAALDVGAFFDKVLDDARLGTVHPLLKRGCAFLMKAAQVEAHKPFNDLDDAQKDDLLLRLSENQMRPDGFSGPTFVRVMLALTLEGVLGDPRHGGNKNTQGWATVGFSPEGRAQGLSLKVLP